MKRPLYVLLSLAVMITLPISPLASFAAPEEDIITVTEEDEHLTREQLTERLQELFTDHPEIWSSIQGLAVIKAENEDIVIKYNGTLIGDLDEETLSNLLRMANQQVSIENMKRIENLQRTQRQLQNIQNLERINQTTRITQPPSIPRVPQAATPPKIPRTYKAPEPPKH